MLTDLYSPLARPGVPEPTKRRCDGVLAFLRSLDEGERVTATELAQRMRAGSGRPYPVELCRKDLHRLDGADLLLSDYGHPERWWAR